MRQARRRTLSILGSVIVPPALLTILIVLNEEVSPSVLGTLGLWARVLVLFPGFLFLVREFRMYALALALVYFPAAYWLSIWVSLWAAIMLGYGKF